jgi:carbamoyltransferase
VLVNTSFNVRSEPIVCNPLLYGHRDRTLVAGNCIARKEDQDPALRFDYKGMFGPG